jgi:hypothetical protein
VKRTLGDAIELIEGKSVEIKSDNQNVPHILKVGSKKKCLQDIVMSVHDQCKQATCNIQLNSKWLPKAANIRADNLSRMSDCDDWEILTILMNCGASIRATDLLPIIMPSVKYSKLQCPECTGVDAFEQV